MNLIMEGWEPTPVTDYAVASDLYARRRNESGLGASAFPDGHVVTPSGMRVARISYNGRVWHPGRWRPGDEPMWDNKNPGAHPAGFGEEAPRAQTLEEHDRLDDTRHHAARVRQAIAALGVRLTHEDAAAILARANGRRTSGQHRRDVLAGMAMTWSHHAAAVAIAERLGLGDAEARRAADDAARSIMRDVVTISGIADMLVAAPAIAAMPIPLIGMDEAEERAVRNADLATLGDLVDRAGTVEAPAMDAALDALTRARGNSEG